MDPYVEERIRAEREASGADCYDEVWEGVYMMSPLPDDEHQEIVLQFARVLQEVIGDPALGKVRPGVNLSDREEDWTFNYRGPDVVVFLKTGRARNLGTHWCGPADFLVEITSPHDQTREKIPFYSRLGVVELLVIERQPWRLELYRHSEGELRLTGQSDLESAAVLASGVVPLTFQLVSGDPRPQIQVTHAPADRTWLV
jgi:Uma2 family endonuclease